MNDGLRAGRLRAEINRLAARGWTLEDGRTRFAAVVSYPLPPSAPALISFLIGLLLGGAADDLDFRRVSVWVDEDGAIHRRTIGDLPPRPRRRGRAWEVPDTDGPGARAVFDQGSAVSDDGSAVSEGRSAVDG